MSGEKWSDWKPWSGGSCPVDLDSVVEIKIQDGNENSGLASVFTWSHYGLCASDIIAYRYKIKEPESTMTPDEEEFSAEEWRGSDGVKFNEWGQPVCAKADKYSAYFKDVRHIDTLDVYRVVSLFDCEKHGHPISHAAKKLLLSGSRTGGKDVESDVREAIDTLHRWLEMREEDARA